jgi:hypothetical protein
MRSQAKAVGAVYSQSKRVQRTAAMQCSRERAAWCAASCALSNGKQGKQQCIWLSGVVVGSEYCSTACVGVLHSPRRAQPQQQQTSKDAALGHSAAHGQRGIVSSRT